METKEIVKIEDLLVERPKDGVASVTTYTDGKPTREQLVTQVCRLQNAFDNVNDGFVAEIVLAFMESGYTLGQVTDMITYVVRTHRYGKVKVSDVLASPNGIVKLVSGRIYNTRPTDEVMSEYYPITKIDGVIYLARKEDVNALTETQKIVLRKLYRQSFGV